MGDNSDSPVAGLSCAKYFRRPCQRMFMIDTTKNSLWEVRHGNCFVDYSANPVTTPREPHIVAKFEGDSDVDYLEE